MAQCPQLTPKPTHLARSKVKRPLQHRRFVEQRVLDGLLATDGVLQVALLDRDGLVACTAPRHDDTVERLGQAISPLDASKQDRVTLHGQHACVMAQSLKSKGVLILKCETGTNLGLVRGALDHAAASLDAAVV